MILDVLFISSLLTLLIFYHARISAGFLDKSNVFNNNFSFISLILSMIGFGYTFLYYIQVSKAKYLICIAIFSMWIILYTKLLNLSLQIMFNNRFERYINLLCITFISIIASIALLSESTQGMKFINRLQTMYFCITGVISIIYFKNYNKRKKHGILQQTLFNSVYRAYVIMFIAELCNRLILFRIQAYSVLITQCIYVSWVIFTLYYLNKYKLEELNFLFSKKCLMDKISDIVILVDNRGKIVELNHKALSLSEYSKEEIKFINIDKLLEEPLQDLVEIAKEDIYSENHRKELQFISKHNRNIPIILSLSEIKNSMGEILGYILVAKDMRVVRQLQLEIKENKEVKDKLLYLSYHDGLTGLYNRAYFEKYIKEFSIDYGQLCCMMICDIDNLKLINDTLGHEAGDELIFMASKLIESSLEPEDMLARIGGDEFVVIIKCGLEQEVKNRHIKLLNTIKNHNSTMPKIPISMSIGMAYGEKDFRLIDLFKEADDNMYRNKLKQSIEAKAIMVDSITNSLITRDFICNGHVDRVKQLSEELGKALGLTSNKIKKIKMLAKYHDIGKVGIPEEILYKSDKLTLEETLEVKRHCEIGYRIAKSTPKLQSIAELILKHHERWDGMGYPLGLKGEDIPIECRIIAIADSFDVMVSGRPYKKAMSKEKVIEEIVNESGKQFDPELVEKFMYIYIKDKFINKNTMNNVINMDIEPKGAVSK